MVVSVVTSTPVSIISSTTRNAVPMSPHLPNAAKGGNKGSHNIINLHIKGGEGKLKNNWTAAELTWEKTVMATRTGN